MHLIKPDTNYNFVGKRKFFLFVSLCLIFISIISFAVMGLNFGIDFAGGTEIQLKFNKETEVSVSKIRDGLAKINLAKSVVQEFGEKKDNVFLIRVDMSAANLSERSNAISEKLKTDFENFKKFEMKGANDGYAVFTSKMKEEEIKNSVQALEISGLELCEVTLFGKETNNEYQIKFLSIEKRIFNALAEVFGEDNLEIEREEMVGPKVGQELQINGLYAIFVALLFILGYIAFRFDMKFAPGAVIALAHDVLIIVGIFSIFQIEFTLSIVAALLAIIGYSLNDTIVVYDRIRDNLEKFKYQKINIVINSSINQTLSRTILTSITTLIVTVTLLVAGGRIIRDFALALTLGVLIGTYSSIYIASPIVIYINDYFAAKNAKK